MSDYEEAEKKAAAKSMQNKIPKSKIRQTAFFQLGAPALISRYQQEEQPDLRLSLPTDQYPAIDASSIQNQLQRTNRLKHRWNHPSTSPKNNAASFVASDKSHKKRQQRKRKGNPSYLAPFGHAALWECVDKRGKLQQHHTSSLRSGPQGNCLLLFACPCPSCCCCEKNDDQSRSGSSEKLRSGNHTTWCVLHPIGPSLDTLIVSTLRLPSTMAKGDNTATMDNDNITTPAYKKEATGTKATPKANFKLKGKTWTQKERKEFELLNKQKDGFCLDDTILDIKQSGSWFVSSDQHKSSTFIARTSSAICIMRLRVMRSTTPIALDSTSCNKSCWGNSVLEELERLDYGSSSPRQNSLSLPSYRPVSLAVHPKYGNDIVGPKFAFVGHSNNEHNIIYACIRGVDDDDDEDVDLMDKTIVQKHHILSLQEVTHIEYTINQPMCLWSAARSYVTPNFPIRQGNNRNTKRNQMNHSYYGLGTSLYTIDLRTNHAIFQWSPSAEEFVTEGVHSINAIMTDWENKNSNRLWVSSKSALKTWEIDARMPYKAINVWSLTQNCEDSETSIKSNKELYGENSLLIKVQQQQNQNNSIYKNLSSPIIQVNTDPGTYGFHIYQRPLHRPTWQTDSLECIMSPQLLHHNQNGLCRSSIAASSIFVLPDNSDDTYTCGISSFRSSIPNFVSDADLQYLRFDDDSSAATSSFSSSSMRDYSGVLCTLTMTNGGDIYCHSLYESTSTSTEIAKRCKSVPNLPIGTSVIAIPSELDDKVWEERNDDDLGVENYNNKLNIFLTNQYPPPRNALIAQENNDETCTKRVRIQLQKRQERKENTSSAADCDTSVPFYASTKPDVHIVDENRKISCLTRDKDDGPLMIPASFMNEATQRLKFTQEKEPDGGGDNGEIDFHFDDSRSDLQMSLLSHMSKEWEKKMEEMSQE